MTSLAVVVGVAMVSGTLIVGDTADRAGSRNSDLEVVSQILLAAGAVTLLVGAFIINLTMSVVLAQRSRELALLRCLGATPQQLRRTVRQESLVIGAFGSAVGLDRRPRVCVWLPRADQHGLVPGRSSGPHPGRSATNRRRRPAGRLRRHPVLRACAGPTGEPGAAVGCVARRSCDFAAHRNGLDAGWLTGLGGSACRRAVRRPDPHRTLAPPRRRVGPGRDADAGAARGARTRVGGGPAPGARPSTHGRHGPAERGTQPGPQRSHRVRAHDRARVGGLRDGPRSLDQGLHRGSARPIPGRLRAADGPAAGRLRQVSAAADESRPGAPPHRVASARCGGLRHRHGEGDGGGRAVRRVGGRPGRTSHGGGRRCAPRQPGSAVKGRPRGECRRRCRPWLEHRLAHTGGTDRRHPHPHGPGGVRRQRRQVRPLLAAEVSGDAGRVRSTRRRPGPVHSSPDGGRRRAARHG